MPGRVDPVPGNGGDARSTVRAHSQVCRMTQREFRPAGVLRNHGCKRIGCVGRTADGCLPEAALIGGERGAGGKVGRLRGSGDVDVRR